MLPKNQPPQSKKQFCQRTKKKPLDEILSNCEDLKKSAQQAGLDKWTVENIKGIYEAPLHTKLYGFSQSQSQKQDITIGQTTFNKVQPNETKVDLTNKGTVKITDTEYILITGYQVSENNLKTVQELKGPVEYLPEHGRFDVTFESIKNFAELKKQEKEWISYFKTYNEGAFNDKGEMVFVFDQLPKSQRSVVCVTSEYLVVQGTTTKEYVFFKKTE
eukprot:TRINITY_DN9726_c0_g1_i1.p2 TRINITY_DN9726_c0_g1~~TRINITY_DN9726_c0_g1_i1.p2  ORF type:complete len:217 (+),score=25.81 TRINITY_DN9726_c0_g1_i1:274-924(+)